jgi:hypothetical protein
MYIMLNCEFFATVRVWRLIELGALPTIMSLNFFAYSTIYNLSQLNAVGEMPSQRRSLPKLPDFLQCCDGVDESKA